MEEKKRKIKDGWTEISHHHLSKVTDSAAKTAFDPKQAKELPPLQKGVKEIARIKLLTQRGS